MVKTFHQQLILRLINLTSEIKAKKFWLSAPPEMLDLPACIMHLLGGNTGQSSPRGVPPLCYACLSNSQHILTMYTKAIEGFLDYVFPHPFTSLFFPSFASIQTVWCSSACPPGQASICFSFKWSVGKKKLLCSKRPNYYLKRVPRSEHLYAVRRCVSKYQTFGEELK